MITLADLPKLKRPRTWLIAFFLVQRGSITHEEWASTARSLKLIGKYSDGDRRPDPDEWDAALGDIPAPMDLEGARPAFRIFRVDVAKFAVLRDALKAQASTLKNPTARTNLGIDGDVLEDAYSLWNTVEKVLDEGDILGAKKILEEEPLAPSLEPLRPAFLQHFPSDDFLER